MQWIDALKHDAEARRSFDTFCESELSQAISDMRRAIKANDLQAAARAEGRCVAFETLQAKFTQQERQEAQHARYRAADPAR